MACGPDSRRRGDGNWNVVADMDWDSIDEAKEVAAQKAGGETLIWHTGQKTS